MARQSEALESLLQALGDNDLSAPELVERLGWSQPKLSRWILDARDQVLRVGRAQRTRYARTRNAGVSAPISITRIDARGEPRKTGELHTIGVDTGSRIAWVEESRYKFYSGLPWFIADMRPQGFLGRQYPFRVPQLGLPPSIADWSDNHVLRALCAVGVDEPGDLILGREALGQFLAQSAPAPVAARDKPRLYGELAARALASGVFYSSAGGEQPKFTAYAETANGAAHVIVKISPAGDDAIAQRWRDLLRAEHYALQTLAAHGILASRSQLVEGERLYLEVERFDRVGERGRRGVVSLAALDDEYVGERHGWIPTAYELHRQGVMTEEDAEQIALLQSFGRLIHNTDMHFGNCALFQDGPGTVRVSMAPAYDMLPMRFAPTTQGLGADDTPTVYPAVDQLPVWNEALKIARAFWQCVLEDRHISASFHGIARVAAAQV